MAERSRGLLDTSVLIDLARIDSQQLPDEAAVAAVTLAELAAGLHATDDPAERARRQDRLQWAAATFEPIAFDAAAARAFGSVFAAVRAAGGPDDRRNGRGAWRAALHAQCARLRRARVAHRAACHLSGVTCGRLCALHCLS